ncbi:MAG: hypothetical protein AAFN10_08380 [Bacteroidota bacterium]
MKNSYLIFLSLLLVSLLPSTAQACSMVSFTGTDGTVWVGNNEDYLNPNTYLWTKGKEKGKYGAVYFGFDNFFAQGGINEAGLVFDGFAMESREVKNLKGKKKTNPAELIHMIMQYCATIGEVKEMADRYRLDFLSEAQLMFVDSKGYSIIIEGDDWLEKGPGESQLCTNFYQSTINNFSEISCPRYLAGHETLYSANPAEMDKNLCRDVINSMHSEEWWGGSLYSNVYDTRRKQIYLYLFHNYEEEVVLSVEELLAEPMEAVRLSTYFKQTEAHDRYVQQHEDIKTNIALLSTAEDTSVLRTAATTLSQIELTRFSGQEVLTTIDGYNQAEAYPKTIAVVEPMMNLFDISWELRAMIAKAEFELGNQAEALVHIEKAIELNPEEPSLQEALEKIKAGKP